MRNRDCGKSHFTHVFANKTDLRKAILVYYIMKKLNPQALAHSEGV